MKKYSLIILTVALFGGSMTLAYLHGVISPQFTEPVTGSLSEGINSSPVLYSGLVGAIANGFINVMEGLLTATAGNALWAIVLLALVVELVLLYPSVRIQIKQKKIHIFHKKLVDKFQKGELSFSKTKSELEKLYDVNEKIHARGAVLVTTQVIVFLAVLWGLNVITGATYLLEGNWDLFNASLMAQPESFGIPLLASLLYGLHALTKIYYREREDYISPAQTIAALTFAVIGAVLVYFFAGIFAVALSAYFITAISFATIRYIVVEQHAKAWGKYAQKELRKQLREATPHQDRFEYISRKWNHLPVVRHINFHLLEEALSMSIGLILALNFFGIIHQENSKISVQPQVAIAAGPQGSQACSLESAPVCDPLLIAGPDDDPSTWADDEFYWLFGPTDVNTNEIEYSVLSKTLPENIPQFCCMPAGNGAFTFDHQVIMMEDLGSGSSCEELPGDSPEGFGVDLNYCGYRVTQIPDVSIQCPGQGVIQGQTAQVNVSGGSGAYYTNPSISEFYGFEDPQITGSTVSPDGTYTASLDTTGTETLTVYDANNPENSASCTFEVRPPATQCSDDFRLRTHNGNTIKNDPGAVNFDVYSKTVYRFYVDNTAMENEIDFDFTEDDAQSPIAANVRRSNGFVEVTTDPGQTSGSATLQIWDPGVLNSEPGSGAANPCRFDINLNLAGEGIQKITPTYVNVGL